MTALAAAGSHSAGSWVALLAIVVIGSGVAAAFTMIIIRLMRRGEPREKQRVAWPPGWTAGVRCTSA